MIFDEYDPYVHDRDPDEPPDLEEDDDRDDLNGPYQRAHAAAVEIVKRQVPGADAYAFALAHYVVEAALAAYDEDFVMSVYDPNTGRWLDAS